MAGTWPVRVVVVEDEPLFRGLLVDVLRRDDGLDLVGAFGDGQAAVAAAAELKPDVALLDLDLGGHPDGLVTGLTLRRSLPSVGLVVLSNHAVPRLLASLPGDGAHGWSYLLKRSVWDVDSLRRAVHGAASGRITLDPLLVARRLPIPGGRLALLTPRQRDIVELLAMGWANARIAERLCLSVKTVDNHLNRIYSALEIDRGGEGLHPRVRAVLLYIEESYEATSPGRLAGDRALPTEGHAGASRGM